ncbi:MAG: lysophospholipid acyltransferase family protein [Candidatus Dependentiae bacterium]|jgi:1-acyl-sn-glycerol-3-phosphate acyltransferase
MFAGVVAFIRRLITYPLMVAVSLVGAALCLLLSLLPASIRYDLRLYHRITSCWSWLAFKVCFIRAAITYEEPLPLYPDDPSIIVANHASALDIPLIEMLLGSYPRMWLSKHIYRRTPILGWLLHRMHVMVNVDSARDAARALARIRRMARDKARHVLLFPEGARFTDGQIHQFFAGFAVLAEKLRRPVRPVFIRNAGKVLAKEGFLINTAHPISLIVGPSFTRAPDESSEQFAGRVRAWFCHHNHLQ